MSILLSNELYNFLLDVDECQEGTHTCNSNSQNCVNAVGSYRCVSKASCPHGYKWSGNKCQGMQFTVNLNFLIYIYMQDN